MSDTAGTVTPDPLPATGQPSLVAKLTEVMASIDRIEKRGYNAHFDYNYPLEADVLDAVRAQLAERHVLVLPEVLSQRREGKLTFASMRFTFIDGDSDERLPLLWEGQGDDNADKGIWKAITGSVKYFLLKAFLIPTGDDPEATDGDGQKTRRPIKKTPVRPAPAAQNNVARNPIDSTRISDAEATRLRGLIKTAGINAASFKTELEKHLGYKKAEDIQRRHYDAICRAVTEGKLISDIRST